MSASIVVPLDFWQDPQSDAILVYSEHECLIYFAFWIAAGEAADFIGQLSFERSCGVRSYGREYLPYELPNTNVIPGFCRFPIQILFASTWPTARNTTQILFPSKQFQITTLSRVMTSTTKFWQVG